MEKEVLLKQPWWNDEIAEKSEEYVYGMKDSPFLGENLLGWRSNNPAWLGLEQVKRARGLCGQQKDKIAQFRTLTDGFMALLKILERDYYNEGIDNLYKIAKRWADKPYMGKEFLSAMYNATGKSPKNPLFQPHCDKIGWVDLVCGWALYANANDFYLHGYVRLCASRAWMQLYEGMA